MSTKNFVSYGDAETLFTGIGNKLSTLKSGLTDLDNEVNGDATVYPYADVITIEDAIPANLADCKVKIEPVQSGSGDPSPTNVRPITGHTEARVQVTDGDETSKTYTVQLGDTIYGGIVDFDSGVLSSYGDIVNEDDFAWGGSTISTGGLHFVTCDVSAVSNVGMSNMLPIESKAWDKTYPCVNIYESRIRVYGNFTTLDEFKEQFSGLQIYYQKATPFTVQLTPQQIQLLKGANTISASTGQISVTVNGVSGAIGGLQEQVNELAEEVAKLHYHKVAESAVTGTRADKLASLYTTYNTLPNDVRKSAILLRNNADIFHAVNNSGTFSNVYVDMSSVLLMCFNLNTGSYFVNRDGTTTDGSSTENTEVYSLWIIE